MKKIVLAITLVALIISLKAQEKVNIAGYGQVRLSYDYLSTYPAFSIRRAKVWFSAANKLDKGTIKFKLKTEFSTKHGANVNLLDAKITYKYKKIEVITGQQTPDFSLQRHQSGEFLPVLERAEVIDKLVPAAETHARDIGIETYFNFDTLHSHISFGIFNGSGANQLITNNKTFLLTSRIQYALIKKPFLLQLGASAMYRQANNLQYNKFFYTDSLFSGRDERYGVEAIFSIKNFSLQSEFIKAYLNNNSAFGYYILADYKLNRNIFAISFENFQDVQKAENTSISATYSYLIQNHNIKLSLSHYYIYNNVSDKNLTILQFQYIFGIPKKYRH